MTTALLILCLILGALFSRALLSLLRWAIALALLVVCVKWLWLLLPELQGVDYSSIGMGAFGATVILIAGYRLIHNWLVDADLARQIERDKQQAAARRI